MTSPISTYTGLHGAAPSESTSLGTCTSLPGLYKYQALSAFIAAFILATFRLGPELRPAYPFR
jgi:hypothetical protein